MKQRVLLPILLSASAAWAGPEKPNVLRDLGPDKKMCLCAFRLLGADAKQNIRASLSPFGLVGAVIGEVVVANTDIAKGENATYPQQLSMEFQNIFEQALRGTGAFQLSAPQGLVRVKDGKPLTLSGVANENDLFACVKVESFLGVRFGFSKNVGVTTRWQIIGPSGWELKIATDATSEEGYGVGPNTGDPKFKPLFLQLARESARQFLEQLSKEMKDAGSRAEVTIVDPDEAPVETLLDPGTFPQPEPECALNSDGKWEKRVALGDGVDIALVYIPNGSFLMGSVAAAGDDYSQPQHEVTIGRAFWLGKLEVTQAQWKAVMGTNPSKFKGDDLPVDSVSWSDCVTFLDALNRRLGRDGDTAFRLPAEAEWEYACRTGTTTKYSFSDFARNLAKYAWFEDNSSSRTHPVGLLRPNAWGVFDMYGNVTEWCEDSWHENYENAPTGGTAWRGQAKDRGRLGGRWALGQAKKLLDVTEDKDRVRRGGHWDTDSSEMRSHSRDSEEAKKGGNTGGFRLVLPALNPQTVLPPPAAPDAAVATPQTAAPPQLPMPPSPLPRPCRLLPQLPMPPSPLRRPLLPPPAAPDAAVATPEPKKNGSTRWFVSQRTHIHGSSSTGGG